MIEQRARSDVVPEHGSTAGSGIFAAEKLGNGCRLLTNCRLGTMTLQLVLIRSATGVALLEIHPVWTATALDLLQARLDEAGFASRFPGNLPRIHRQIHPRDLPKLEEILAEAFVGIDPFTLEGCGGWEDALQDLLTPVPVAAPTATAKTPAHGASPVAEPLLEPAIAMVSADTPLPTHVPMDIFTFAHLATNPSEALASRAAPVAPLASIASVSTSQLAREAQPRSKAWMGFAAAGVAAAALFSLPHKAGDAPELVEVLRDSGGALPMSQTAAIAYETPAPVIMPAIVSSAVIAVQDTEAPPAADDPAPLAVVQASSPATPIQEPIPLLTQVEPTLEPPDVQGTPITAGETQPQPTSPLPEPPLVQAEPFSPGPVLAQVDDRLDPFPLPEPIEEPPFRIRLSPAQDSAPMAPLPESEPVEGEPFWARSTGEPLAERLEPAPEISSMEQLRDAMRSVPERSAERVEPFAEDTPLQGPPFWAMPPRTAAPPVIAPTAAPSPPAAPLPPTIPQPAGSTQLPTADAPAAPMAATEPTVVVPPVGVLPLPPVAAPSPPVPPPAQPTPAVPAVTRPAPAFSPAEIEAARRRGEALVALGDMSGGRRFLERAALAGSGPAALAMAESFDPRVLAARGVIGMPPDRAAAIAWYRRALALGVAESASRIATLEAER